jgi:Uma2 family endonuclease
MAEPARNLPPPKDTEPDDETSGTATFLRWVERPDGRLELLEMPLTPEVFLDPQLEDQMTQGEWHSEATTDLAADIRGFLRSKRDDALVLSDVKHYLGIPGLPNPAPDVSVIYGIRRRLDKKRPNSFDLVKERVRPSFVLEVISPDDRRIRRADEVDKVEIYERVGIPEYFLVDTPRRGNGFRLHVKGYRLNSRGRYRLIQPDPEGRLLSEQTGLWFAVSPNGDRIVMVDAATGKRLLYREEQEAALQAAEAEIARLRERLKEMGG